jgi:Na+-translocating ferredoxin:NAD+ oxidoreductase RnfE subunit
VRQEVSLAKAEMTQKATVAGKNIGFLLIGAAVAYAGLLAILAAIIIALGHAVGYAVAALIVGVVVAAVAVGLVMKGINALKGENLAPQQTIETVKEDIRWAKHQVAR